MSHGNDGAASGGGDLRHSLLKNRIAKLPHLPAIAPHVSSSRDMSFDERDEASNEEADAIGEMRSMPAPSSLAKARSAASDIASGSAPRPATARRALASRELYAPASAADCFDEALEVEIGDISTSSTSKEGVRPAPLDEGAGESLGEESQNNAEATFRVYFTPPRKRASNSTIVNARDKTKIAETDSLDSITLPDVDDDEVIESKRPAATSSEPARSETSEVDPAGTVFFLHHGAGYSALSFALVAKHITQSTLGSAGVLAYDCRGHGKTRHRSDAASRELSIENLTDDAVRILDKLFPSDGPQPTLVLVGHSMGGAVVVSLAHVLQSRRDAGKPRLAGVAVLDVVEGTAMSALPHMKGIVSALPPGFHSLEDAIRWHIDSGTIVNLESAKRSVPSLLRRTNTEPDPILHAKAAHDSDEPVEELTNAEDATLDSEPGKATQFAYVWRHNLLATEPYWHGWFSGLSQRFLACKCARLLLLAGTDRLDKDLMIGQMQGKFQMTVFADVGHSLQEDAPQRTADALVQFWRRNETVDVAAIRGLRKVGQ